MNSCFYEGTVVHERFTPVPHRFCYRLYMTYVDLAELDALFGRRGVWSTRGPALVRFRRADYLGDRDQPLDGEIRRLVETRTGFRPAGPIRLLTNFCVAGFGMNPVSFYYCYDSADRRVDTLVAEVTNTPWGERHCYVIRREPNAADGMRDERPVVAKALHVSPFMTMDIAYRWRIGEPGERLTIGIENLQHGERPFQATLRLKRRPMTAWQRMRLPVRYPLLPQRIALGIYAQALRLWWKGVPTVPHPGYVDEVGDETSAVAGESVGPVLELHRREYQREKAAR